MSVKIDIYLTCEEILPFAQSRIIEQAKFTYSSFGKAFGKQIKTIENQGIKQVEALKDLKPKEKKKDIKSIEELFSEEMKTNEIKNKIYEIKKWEEKIKRKDLIYKANKYKYNFQQYKTIRSFGTVNISEAEMDQRKLLTHLLEFNDRSRPRTTENKDEQRKTLKVTFEFFL